MSKLGLFYFSGPGNPVFHVDLEEREGEGGGILQRRRKLKIILSIQRFCKKGLGEVH